MAAAQNVTARRQAHRRAASLAAYFRTLHGRQRRLPRAKEEPTAFVGRDKLVEDGTDFELVRSMAVDDGQQRCIQPRLAHGGAEECLRLTESRKRPLRRGCCHRQVRYSLISVRTSFII